MNEGKIGEIGGVVGAGRGGGARGVVAENFWHWRMCEPPIGGENHVSVHDRGWGSGVSGWIVK